MTIKRLSIACALLLTLQIADFSFADYLEVRRATQIKASPRSDSRDLVSVAPGINLRLVSSAQSHGYYRVESTDGQTIGWLYRSFVRRWPGELPTSSAPAAANDDRGDGDAGLHGTTDVSHGEETFDGYQPYDPAGRWYVYGGLPRATSYPNPLKILRNTGYVVGYDDVRHDPAWAAYRAFRFKYKKPPSRPGFKVDKRTDSKISTNDYSHEDYSRGHMAPNYAIYECYGEQAQLESFLMSNICPQFQSLNAGSWGALEAIIADGFAQDYDEVWVICGPIFNAHPDVLRSKPVEVPSGFFMIIVDEDAGKPRALAFEFEQANESGGTPESHLTSIKKIEADTGLNFLADLDDSIEVPLEAAKAEHLWSYTLRPHR